MFHIIVSFWSVKVFLTCYVPIWVMSIGLAMHLSILSISFRNLIFYFLQDLLELVSVTNFLWMDLSLIATYLRELFMMVIYFFFLSRSSYCFFYLCKSSSHFVNKIIFLGLCKLSNKELIPRNVVYTKISHFMRNDSDISILKTMVSSQKSMHNSYKFLCSSNFLNLPYSYNSVLS